MRVAKLKGGLQRVLVNRIDDALHALADEGIGLRVDADLGALGDLLDANDDVHWLPSGLRG
jgi:hypothetical protein